MSDTDTRTEEQAELDETSTSAAASIEDKPDRGPLGTFIRYFGMPIFLAVALVLNYLWIQGQDLGAIEQRQFRADRLLEFTIRHIELTFYSSVIVLALAIPLGIVATRPKAKRFAPAIIGLGNAGQAIPSLGLLGIIFFLARTTDLLPSTGIVPALMALVVYSFLPILRNTMVGLQQVDEFVLEAGRGMGMSNARVLRKLELPLSVPVILAGIRTALVLNVGTATIVFFTGGGGLGQVIFSGFQTQRTTVLVTGSVMVASLALMIDHIAGIVEDILTPKGL
jgi:osmoprotectant transport system permease protein